MSQPVQDEFNLEYAPIVRPMAGHLPQPGQNHPTQGQSDFIDGSGPLFRMYLDMADEEDKKRTDSWQADADGILIFTGLFSAAVATLASVSVQDLKPNSQDISAFYLAKMYQLSADSNGSQVLIPSTLSDPSIPFSPPIYAIWVNSLWFLSLVISLTCAFLATLLQQWARRYMKFTQKRYSLHKRARIRAFFAEGVDDLNLPVAVEALPALLHLSLFLFFVGLAVFLFNTNHTVFKVAMSWIGICTGIYILITFMPIFRPDSPYYAPLSFPAWYIYNGTLSTVIGMFRRITRFQLRGVPFIKNRNLGGAYQRQRQRQIVRDMEKELEETALKASSEIDGRALVWTFESLDEDHELERFFSGILDFCNSKEVEDPRSSLAKLTTVGLGDVLLGFWQRTLSSDLVSERIKERRFVICVRVIDAVHLSRAALDILDILFEPQQALFRSVEIGRSLTTRGDGDGDDQEIASFAQGIISFIIANAPQHDPRWFSLTVHHLRISEHVLRGYLDHGDSMLLANLIHITRQLLRNFENRGSWDVAITILPRLSKLRVQDTLPGLQHGFCQLWNDIVLETHARYHYCLSYILLAIRPIYLALHQGTDAAPTAFSASVTDLHPISLQESSYPLCAVPSHNLDPASNPNGVDDGRTMETARAPLTTSPAEPRSDATPSVTPFVANSKGSPSPPPGLDRMNPQPVDELSCNEVPPVPQRGTWASSSCHPAPLENDNFLDSAVAGPVQRIANYTPHGGLELPPSSLIPTSSLLTPPMDPDIDSNAMTEAGPLDVPDDTLGPNRHIMSQSPTSSSPNIAEDNLRPENCDPSENV